MKEFESLSKAIKNKQLLPIYFLQGEEPFYIDRLIELLENESLEEHEKAFDQLVCYASDVSPQQVVLFAREFPIMASKKVVIVKEAQNWKKEAIEEALQSYVANPSPTTVLAIAYKTKPLDNRKSFTKSLGKFLFTSEKVKDYQLSKWIQDYIHRQGLMADTKTVALLADFLGNDLSKIANEVEKLKIILKGKKTLTPEIIEENIGISKDYNPFELTKAIAARDLLKALTIVDYFAKNSKNYPLQMIIPVVFDYFNKLLSLHCLEPLNIQTVKQTLGIPVDFIAQEYLSALKAYPMKAVTGALRHLQEADLRSKGILPFASTKTDYDILSEMIFKIISHTP